MQQSGSMNGLLRAGLRVILVVVLVEVASFLGLLATRPLLSGRVRTTRDIFREQSDRIRQLLEPESTRMVVLDSVLGWRYRPHQDSLNQVNAVGLRSRREYSVVPRRGGTRVAAFGDSFVYGNEVANEESWTEQLERAYPGVEVLNYGVGGYGVDQAFLRYLAEGSDLSPAIVIMGFATDDLTRVTNVYRRFRANDEYPLVKPRYILDDAGGLVLLPPPLRGPDDYRPYLADPRRITALGVHDEWYEPAIYRNPLYDYSATVRLVTQVWILAERRLGSGPRRLVRDGVFSTTSNAFRIQVALFQAFADSVKARGARPLVVLFPDEGTISLARAGGRTVLAPLAAALAERGIEYVDLTDAFREAQGAGVDAWFMPGGHYSPAGNGVAAAWLGKYIAGRPRPRGSTT